MFVDLDKRNLLYKIYIVVSSLILKMRSEEIFLSKCRCFSMDLWPIEIKITSGEALKRCVVD